MVSTCAATGSFPALTVGTDHLVVVCTSTYGFTPASAIGDITVSARCTVTTPQPPDARAAAGVIDCSSFQRRAPSPPSMGAEQVRMADMAILHNRIGDDIILDLLHRREDQIHQSADAFDVKAGLVLATAAFLAMQPAYLLTLPHLSDTAVSFQIGSFMLLLAAVWFAILVLKITAYPTPGITENWRDEQVMLAPPDAKEKDIYGTVLWEAINQAKSRVEQASDINNAKATKLLLAQVFSVLAFLMNVAVPVTVYVNLHA